MTSSKIQQKHFEQVSTLLAREGNFSADALTRYMQPLLGGEMTLEQHEAWLLQQLAEVGDA